ncbi:hypothetical protein JTB14_021993 [Gonioctena quinquepunctata]|nr:hypothetical protein JTB14_021993 [Gonioctena quinquepunctata]
MYKSNAEDLAQLLHTHTPLFCNGKIIEAEKIEKNKTTFYRRYKVIKQLSFEINFDKLSKKFDKQSRMELSGAVLLGLLIFDRRRPGELERALLTDLDTLVSMNKDTLLNHNLNDAEQEYIPDL